MAMAMAVGGKEPSLMLTSGATGRINALLSVQALRSLLNAVLLLLLLPFRRHLDDNCHRKAVVRVPAASRKSSSGGRRALAIRRVLEDVADDTTGCSLREYWLFRTARGDTIFTQSWTPLPLNISPRALVLLMHGLNEHCGRYTEFAKQLNANGYKVYGMDWVGHGGSDGLHGYVHSLDDAVADMKIFLEKVLTENSGLPCFCFGHSSGGAITLKVAYIAGAVLTSPAVGVEASHPVLLVLAPVISFLLPTYQFGAACKKGLPVSRDTEALIAKYSDPLVCTSSLRVRTGYEILRITSYLQQNLRKVRVPFLVLHGTADSVTDPGASQRLYEEASSSDKTIRLYEGFLHDMLFEPERDAITQDIIQWLNSGI